MHTKKLPIGYWIKLADQELTKAIDRIQSAFGLSRTEWQIINSISEKKLISRSELNILMSPFVDTKTVDAILEKLSPGQIITDQNDKLELTKKGIDLHAACLEKQKIFRQMVMNGIADQEYQTTVLTLQKMIENIAKKSE